MYRIAAITLLALILFATGCQKDEASSVPSPEAVQVPDTQKMYYISPQGNDLNKGTIQAPWKTLQHAADHAPPGSTVYLREGLYHQKVKITRSGNSSGNPTLFSSYPQEKVIIDGEGLSVRGIEGLIEVENASYITIQNLEICNFTTSLRGQVPTGIYVHGSGEHIQLLGNTIHSIANGAKPSGPNLQGRDAHGIAIYGTEHPQALRDIIIKDNELYDLVLGSSESLAVNGNVDTFAILDNTIHDTDNIGIDLIGYEGTSEDDTYDLARNGIVRGNEIYNISSNLNPSYGTTLPNDSNSAGGIYVDGGKNHIIDHNRVYRNDIGIEIASEHAGRSTSNITLQDNLIFHNRLTGIAMGGYDEQRGSTEDSMIMYNTLVGNDLLDAGNGQLFLQAQTKNNTFKRNILVSGSSDVLIYNEYTSNSGNVFDHNVYYSPAPQEEALWVWKKTEYSGFTSYTEGSGNDVHSLYVNPQFVDEANEDFTLQANSPAKENGFMSHE
ncbi:right-handed parallel beta-helix repeat-containing protein [Paenibacillus taichungensis]|uniref:right-handed parallel beta-helix repeat-containing protein n=1 Tax=Paenibacillus taichungensis TaxID=484184 RepID=UPI002DB7BF90|nr:right-handed parallel beta-helix repeat-containing protein [Paenibacillus taichungensis]MEC0108569.1 right-handed parallel beta-helix repeat-containing protein [Paenibacillus taichungensis]MEC0196068.1 right-handed parallel beta-helix repeat-containing protein [Paenibacillus taichungensis]